MTVRMVASRAISIHSLLAEGDVVERQRLDLFDVISIHSLLAEGDTA